MQRLRFGLAVLVAVVWLVGYVLAYTDGGQAPTELSGLMAVVLGWAFAGTLRDSITRKADDDGPRDEPQAP